MEEAIKFFMNLSPDVRWGHRGYWLAVSANRIVARDKNAISLIERVRGLGNQIYIDYVP